ncbi:MAG: hypothetical protein IPP60_06010 [Sphingobacteriales bacterium]|nr:hypothetical protein [Sphingobacteriales bacterium]
MAVEAAGHGVYSGKLQPPHGLENRCPAAVKRCYANGRRAGHEATSYFQFGYQELVRYCIDLFDTKRAAFLSCNR